MPYIGGIQDATEDLHRERQYVEESGFDGGSQTGVARKVARQTWCVCVCVCVCVWVSVPARHVLTLSSSVSP
jgi:hypothetical protein